MRRRAVVAGACLALLAIAAGASSVERAPTVASPTARPTHTAAPSATSAPTPGSASPAPLVANVAASTPTPSASARPKRKSSAPLTPQRTTGKKAVALTFDDGPHPVWTPKLLDELRKARVKATFCLIGSQVKKHPELVARIAREGHTLCNHSWNHEQDLGQRSEAAIRANLVRTNKAIQQAAPGTKVRFFRHPYGAWTPRSIKVARALGMTSLHWSTDPRDWEKPGANVIKRRVERGAHSGAIVLLHDGGGDRSDTLAACPGIIRHLKERYGITRLA